MYHWHPLMPEEFNISGTIYTVKDFLFRPDLVLKHGMRDFVDGLVHQRAGAVSINLFIYHLVCYYFLELVTIFRVCYYYRKYFNFFLCFLHTSVAMNTAWRMAFVQDTSIFTVVQCERFVET